MRDPNRIDTVCEALKRLWKLAPDMRLGQLICNTTDQRTLFYTEDDKLLERLVKEYEDISKDRPSSDGEGEHRLIKGRKSTLPMLVKVVSIKAADNSKEDMREQELKSVGKKGTMVMFMAAEGKYKGKWFIRVSGETELQTGAGELTLGIGRVTLTAKEAVYEFELTDEMSPFLT